MQGKAKKSIKILSFLHWVHLTLQLNTFFLCICAEENGRVDEKDNEMNNKMVFIVNNKNELIAV